MNSPKLLVVYSLIGVGGFYLFGQSCRSGARDVIKTGGEEAGELLKKTGEVAGQAAKDAGEAVGGVTKGGKPGKGRSGGQQGQTAKDPRDTVQTIADIFHRGTQTIDQAGSGMVPLSVEREIAIGRQFHGEVRKSERVVDDPVREARLRSLAEPMLKHTTRKGFEYTFKVIESKQVNAFAHLGGYVYVYSGLIDAVGDRDDELQFVIGHEIGHIELKHVLNGVGYISAAQEVGGELAAGLVSVLYQNITAGYSEDQEYEADAWSYKKMRVNGVPRDRALAGSRWLATWAESQGAAKEDGRADSVPGEVGRQVRNHFRTHPPPRERVRRLESIPERQIASSGGAHGGSRKNGIVVMGALAGLLYWRGHRKSTQPA